MSQTREDKAAAARVRMAELAAKFLERSRHDLEVMRGAVAKLNAGESDALRDIYELAHRMCGTGATLGFETLGEHAARVEHLAEPGPAGTLPDQGALMLLAAGIEALAAEVADLEAANKRLPGR
jgi:chemotaxis protein histidine kinase CheA